MTDKTNKIIYWISTGLLTVLMLMSAGMYFFNYEEISQIFLKLGFPVFVVYPLATAKILGLIAIWTNISKSLKEWAYAGFFFNFLLAFSAHFYANDGEYLPAIIALILLFVSYFFNKKIK
ncbi:MAG: DoxX family protein [Saprospiraceae bacterium]